MRRRLSSVLLLAAFIAAALALRALVAPQLDAARLTAFLRELGGGRWAVPAFIGLYLCGTTLFLPAVLFHVVAGAMWGFGPAVALNFALANVVSNLQFLAGRALGRARVLALLERRGWTGVARQLDQRGAVAMLIVRQLPLPFVGVNVAAGVSPLTWRQFALGSGAGLVPQVGVYTWFAASIADGVEGASEAALVRALAAGATVVALALVSQVLLARRQ